MERKDVDRRLEQLLDKQDICELLCRYCRARDRLDLPLMLECFHPEATGLLVGFKGVSDGPVADFHHREIEVFRSFAGCQHYITNFLCEVEGDEALSETYQFSFGWGMPTPEGPVNLSLSNRYIDRFERRDGQWKIIRREFYRNFARKDHDAYEFPSDANGWPRSSHDRSDPAYQTLKDMPH
jgi:hypothetical protein